MLVNALIEREVLARRIARMRSELKKAMKAKRNQAVAQDGEALRATHAVSPPEASERAPSAEPKTDDPITPDLLR
jgi:hypothetical protein